ncbi:MAG: hypothetical protein IPK56_11425 [Elusimicrobia bacterium]|nr:hypothetical protein [Elusimicrobiota bacterium]
MFTTGAPSFQSIRCGYSRSLSVFSKSSNTAILRLPTTTSFCSLNGCSHDTKIWAFTPLGNDNRLTVTSAIFSCK